MDRVFKSLGLLIVFAFSQSALAVTKSQSKKKNGPLASKVFVSTLALGASAGAVAYLFRQRNLSQKPEDLPAQPVSVLGMGSNNQIQLDIDDPREIEELFLNAKKFLHGKLNEVQKMLGMQVSSDPDLSSLAKQIKNLLEQIENSQQRFNCFKKLSIYFFEYYIQNLSLLEALYHEDEKTKDQAKGALKCLNSVYYQKIEEKINNNNQQLSELEPGFLEFLTSPEESYRKFMTSLEVLTNSRENFRQVLAKCFISNAHQDAQTLLTNLKSEIQGFEPLLDNEQRSNLEKTLNLFKEFHKIFPKSINEVDYSETLKDKLINFFKDNSLQLESIFGTENLKSLRGLLDQPVSRVDNFDNFKKINFKIFNIYYDSFDYSKDFLSYKDVPSSNFMALVHYTFCLSFSQKISELIFYNTDELKDFLSQFSADKKV